VLLAHQQHPKTVNKSVTLVVLPAAASKVKSTEL
jgi:hypothetical protein